MKRKFIIAGDEKMFMQNIFQLSEEEVDNVKKFLEQDFNDVPGLMKLLINSELSPNQKILASYIMGNTVGIQMIRDMKNMTEERKTDIGSNIAG